VVCDCYMPIGGGVDIICFDCESEALAPLNETLDYAFCACGTMMTQICDGELFCPACETELRA